MTEERKYIYSVIKNPKEMLGSGIAGLAAGMQGINNRDIVFVTYRDLAAAVSSIHLIHFDQLDKKELNQSVAVHEQVNANLMKDYDIIPMRFGMIAESAEEIRNILAKAYIKFKTVMERVAGKAEFIVQVFWDEKNMLGKIVQENTEIRELKKEVESKGKLSGFFSKIKLGKRIFEEIQAYRKKYTQNILGDLATRFPDFSAGKLLKTTMKEMIMNHSFLIERTQEQTLESRLNQLAEKYKDELKFKYIGPMAPYSFAVINLSQGNFDLVDKARKTLGLNESTTFPEVKEAYYKLATQFHPDKLGDKKGQAIREATKKTKDIVTAYEILTIYCKHYLSSIPSGKEQICSFKKEDVENSVIIKESQLA